MAPLKENIRFASISAVCFALLLLLSPSNSIDPSLFLDDYPALLGDADEFYIKTLTEGRWLNYLWHLRPILLPAPVHYALFMLGWAVFAASTAVSAFGRDAPPWYLISTALLITVCPAHIFISLWSVTLVPASIILGVYGVINLVAKRQTALLALLLMTPLALMAYSSHPFLLLVAFLTRRDTPASVAKLGVTVALFGCTFVAGTLAIYELNYMAHCHFGVIPGQWRNAVAAENASQFIGNVASAPIQIGTAIFEMLSESYPVIIIITAVFAYCIFDLLKSDAQRLLSDVAASIVGLGLLTLYLGLSGVTTPYRAYTFLWVTFAVVVGRTMVSADKRSLGGPLRIAAIFFIASFSLSAHRYFANYSSWQSVTQKLAQSVRSVAPNAEFVELKGDLVSGEHFGDVVFKHRVTFAYRMEYLLEVPSTHCEFNNRACPTEIGEVLFQQPGIEIAAIGNGALVTLAGSHSQHPAFVNDETTASNCQQ